MEFQIESWPGLVRSTDQQFFTLPVTDFWEVSKSFARLARNCLLRAISSTNLAPHSLVDDSTGSLHMSCCCLAAVFAAVSSDADKPVRVNTASDEVKLSDSQANYGFMWLPCTNLHEKGETDTVLKIDTAYQPTGTEPKDATGIPKTTLPVVGQYYTGYDPSRTAVDSNGNGWIAHREGTSLQRVGLWEVGQCIDFDGDNKITTSKSTLEDDTMKEGSWPKPIEAF
jgi:hypothetical protein